MYQNAALVQTLADTRVAELRRTTEPSERRSLRARADVALRLARPLRDLHRR